LSLEHDLVEATLACVQYLFSFFIVWTPVVAVYLTLRIRKLHSTSALIISISLTCLFSYMIFLTAWVEIIISVRYLLNVFVLAIFVVSIFGIAKNRRNLNEILSIVATSFFIGLISLLTGLSKGVMNNDLGVQHTLAVRYWSSVDNKIPGFLARGILQDMPMKPYLFADWKGSDRPPLVSGWLCVSRTLLNSKYGETSLLIVAATLLVPLICVLLASFNVGKKYWTTIAVVIFSTPFAFTNTVYTWPKIVAGLLFLLALSVFWIEEVPLKYWLIGMTSALAFLAHGSTLFMLPGLIYIAIKKRTSILNSLTMLSAAVICYAPWLYFQRYWDRSSNRLIYWHIAGQSGGTTDKGIINTIVDNYSVLKLTEILNNKFANFSNLLIVKDKNPAIEGLSGFPGVLNAWASETILGSLWPVAVFALIFYALSRKWSIEVPREYFFSISMSLIFFTLMEFGQRPDSIASAHIAPLSIAIFFAVVLAGQIIVTVDYYDQSGWIITGLVFLFLLINFTNYGLLTGVNAAEGGNGGSLSISLCFAWLIASLVLCSITKCAFKQNDHDSASAGVLV